MHLEFVINLYWYIIKQDLKKTIEKVILSLGGALKLVRGPRNLIKTSPIPTTKPNRKIFTVFYIYLGPITRLRADCFFNHSV